MSKHVTRLLAVTLLLVSSCSGGDRQRPGSTSDGDSDSDSDSDSDQAECIDQDEDEYGINCAAGPDCDDLDPNAWEGQACLTCEADIAREGCACPGEDTEPAYCKSDELFEDEHGRWRCKSGDRYCVLDEDDEEGGYIWSECIFDGGFV